MLLHVMACTGVPLAEGVRGTVMPRFSRYVGIDYSGAETPTSSLSGLRVFTGRRNAAAVEVSPAPIRRKYWTRQGIAEWLVGLLRQDELTLVGIDHGFSFPRRYFEEHGLAFDWQSFLDDFCRHWPTDGEHVYVDFVRAGELGDARARSGDPRWRRLSEVRAGAKSVFHFDVQGSVAKSTHAGLPWLRFVRQQVSDRAHFWPFDGWNIPPGRSALVEVYPSLWRGGFPRQGRNDHQHDAFVAAEWLRRADLDGTLGRCLSPPLDAPDRATATFEGWILGVMEDARADARPPGPRGRPRRTPGSTSRTRDSSPRTAVGRQGRAARSRHSGRSEPQRRS
jgi:hypothetical protein